MILLSGLNYIFRKIKRNNNGGALSTIISLIVIIFLGATAAMYFTLPRPVVEKVPDVEEKEQEVVKYSPADIETLTEQLQAKEQQLAAKENLMKAQEDRIAQMQKELDDKQAEVLRYQEVISQTVTQVMEAEKKNISKLSKVFSMMPPEEAVAIVRKLDDSTVVSVLGMMKDRASAKILGAYAKLGEVHAERVARLSEMMRTITKEEPAK